MEREYVNEVEGNIEAARRKSGPGKKLVSLISARGKTPHELAEEVVRAHRKYMEVLKEVEGEGEGSK